MQIGVGYTVRDFWRWPVPGLTGALASRHEAVPLLGHLDISIRTCQKVFGTLWHHAASDGSGARTS